MLLDEITQAQRLVRTDAYPMSISEIASIYADEEIIIDPEFQRLFRWNISQKSKLIESLLLGIPLPSIFVFERAGGQWELIDGLQRIATILEFMGRLKGADGLPVPPSGISEATKYLPSLHNTVWEASEDVSEEVPIKEQNPLDKASQLAIRRARIGVEILKRPSDEKTKFDLFQRLNAGGTQANPQELRNCIMLMVNGDYFRAIRTAADRHAFRSVIAVSEELVEKQRHLELAVRFLVHTYIPYDGTLDVEEYIDTGAITLATKGDTARSVNVIDQTFNLLNSISSRDVLRRFEGGRHVGKVGLVALEAIAVGVAKNIDAILALPNSHDFVKEKIETFWSQEKVASFTLAGLRGTTRIQRTVPFGGVVVPTVTKPYLEADLRDQLTQDRSWRLKEISDLKSATLRADPGLRNVLLRALITICYAHWEGYVRFASRRYLEHIALRKIPYGQLDRQFLRNHFLPRLGSLSSSRASVSDRCDLVDEILNASDRRFSRVNEEIVSTRSNLNYLVFSDICLVCGVPMESFANQEIFIDKLLLKRRNAIAHGEDTLVGIEDLETLTTQTIALMRGFGDALENRISLRGYMAA